jgi:CDP-diacylglycerol--serine O-phosphatidyltransferase
MSYRIIVLRIILAFLLIPIIVAKNYFLSIFFFLLAGVLSIVEDVVRKRFAYRAPKRVIVDYVADKALISISAFSLWFVGLLPWWFMGIVVGKDILTVIASVVLILRSEYVELRPVITAKIAYVLQLISILLVLLQITDSLLLGITAVLTVIAAIEGFWKSEFRKMKKKKTSQFSLVKMITIADMVTLSNGIAGLSSILLSINEEFAAAAICLVVAVVLDFLDGKVAQMLKTQHEFGKELDSLADTISFGVAPAILGYGLIQTKFAMVAFVVFVFCGVLRLARYNILAASGMKGFIGLPITVNGMIIPLLYFCSLEVMYYPYVYLLLGFLMISTIRVGRI